MEAWCYDIDGSEKGYILIDRRWHGGVANQSVRIHAPSLDNRANGCVSGTEERGAVPCVKSGLLD